MLSAVFLFGRVFVCFVLVCQCSVIILPFICFREFNKANFNCNDNEYNGCVRVRCNSLFISLPLFTQKSQNNNGK